MLAGSDLVTSLRTRTRHVTVNGLTVPVTLWEEPATIGVASQDATLVQQFGPEPWNDHCSVLRIVVADGVTPVAGTEEVIGVGDPAVFAARTVTRAFARPAALRDCAVFANDFLARVSSFARMELTRRERPQAVVRAVDLAIDAGGLLRRVDVLNAGDATSHLCTGSGWVDPVTERCFADAAMLRWQTWADAHPNASLRDTQRMENEIFATPDDFDSTPLGAFADPDSLKLTIASHVDSLPRTLADLGLVVATDGLRVAPTTSPNTYFDHLAAGAHRLPSTRHIKQADDVAVIAVGNLAPSLGAVGAGVAAA